MLRNRDPEAKVSVQSFDDRSSSTFLYANKVPVKDLPAKQHMTPKERGATKKNYEHVDKILRTVAEKDVYLKNFAIYRPQRSCSKV